MDTPVEPVDMRFHGEIPPESHKHSNHWEPLKAWGEIYLIPMVRQNGIIKPNHFN